jgi:hypothetical protein
MKVKTYNEKDLSIFEQMTEKNIELFSWGKSICYVVHQSGNILKCEATKNKAWRVLGTKKAFKMEVNQLFLNTKKNG